MDTNFKDRANENDTAYDKMSGSLERDMALCGIMAIIVAAVVGRRRKLRDR